MVLQIDQETHTSRGDIPGFLDGNAEGTVLVAARKQLGYGHIAGRHSQQLHAFNRHVPSLYLNYQRPCCFFCQQVDAKRKRYGARTSWRPTRF